MIFAKQSTAIIVTVGPVLDASGVAVTDGIIGDFKGSKNGGAPAALNASATLTHRHTGFYSLSLTATDVNTVGTLEIVIDDTVNACPMKEITVLEEVIYDALFAGSANAFTGAAGSTKVTGVVLTDTVTTYTGNTPQTGDNFARLGAPAGASVSADIAAIEAQTDDIGVAGAGLTAIPDLAGVTTLLSRLSAVRAGYLDNLSVGAVATSAQAVQIISDIVALNDPSAAAIADAVWDEAMTELAAVPAVTASFRDAMRWLFLLSRNKITQTATTQLLRNDADSGTVGTSTLSDDGTTFVRGEFS